MKNYFKKLLLVSCFAALISSCEEQEKFESDKQLNVIDSGVSDEMLIALTEQGYDTENFPVLKIGNEYIVEGDIVLPYTEKELLALEDLKQRRVKNKISCNRRKIRVKSNLNKLNTGRLRKAIQRWNNAKVGGIKFSLVSKNANITVNNTRNNKIWADALYPFKGKPGSNIRFNQNRYKKGKYSGEHVIDVLTHELGHTIGLAHTSGKNNVSTTHISGTSRKDKNSIMFARLKSNGSPKITGNDKKAVRQIYKGCK